MMVDLDHIVLFVLATVMFVPTLQQPPGIPPVQHQQQQHNQQPVQQMQQPPQGQPIPPQGQPPATPQHGGGSPGGGHGGFGNVHDKEHIKEHLQEIVDKPKEEMTEEELEFHYFKLHDYDGNNKLDGIEITKAITHFHHEDEEGEKKENDPDSTHAPPRVFTDEEIINIVDMVMKEDDLDNDGYIEYIEFVAAQRKHKTETPAEPIT